METKDLIIKHVTTEPKRSNQWIIYAKNKDGLICIPEYLFRRFKYYSKEGKLFLETSFYETIDFNFDIRNIDKLHKFYIVYVDPTGTQLNAIIFKVKTIEFSASGDYSNDELFKYDLVMEVTTDC